MRAGSGSYAQSARKLTMARAISSTDLREFGIRRVYAVGDLHGRLDLFTRLIAMIAADKEGRGDVPTQLVLLGDLVDRGPDSASLIQGCMKLAAASDQFTVLKGNHEWMMAEALTRNHDLIGLWLRVGGRETLLSWGMDAALVDSGDTRAIGDEALATIDSEVFSWIDSLPLSCRFGDHLMVHAGIRPGRALSRQTGEDLMWIRNEFLACEEDFGVTVVHGHSINEAGPEIRSNRIGIDTGAFRTGRLTALGIESLDRWTLTAELPVAGDARAIDTARYQGAT